MTLAEPRNLTRLCPTVLQTPPKIQLMEPLLPLLHIFALNNPIIYRATQGQTPPPASILLCMNTVLYEHSKRLGAGWVSSMEKELFKASGQAAWLHRLSQDCPASSSCSFSALHETVFVSFSLRHMTPKRSDWGTTWVRVWKLGSSSYSELSLDILY